MRNDERRSKGSKARRLAKRIFVLLPLIEVRVAQIVALHVILLLYFYLILMSREQKSIELSEIEYEQERFDMSEASILLDGQKP